MNASHKNVLRKPDAGNLHVRFDEGEGSQRSLVSRLSSRDFLPYSTGSIQLPRFNYGAVVGTIFMTTPVVPVVPALVLPSA